MTGSTLRTWLDFSRKELEWVVFQADEHQIIAQDGESIEDAIRRVMEERFDATTSDDQIWHAIYRTVFLELTSVRGRKYVQFDLSSQTGRLTALFATPSCIAWCESIS